MAPFQEELIRIVRARAASSRRPFVVALDGPSGAGKSTLALALAARLDATVLEGDDFFAGGVEIRGDSPEQRAADCIDWRRQRAVLEALRADGEARYFAFDWDAFDGRLRATATTVVARDVVLLEGVYAARPELRDLVDLAVLLRIDDALRTARLLAREGSIGPWERQWHQAEAWYFEHAAPAERFDLVIDAAALR